MEIGELSRNPFSKQYCTRLAADRDACGISPWTMTGIDRRAVLGGHVARIDNVFHIERNADQRAARAATIARPCLRYCLFRIYVLPSLHLVIAFCDAFETC